MKTLAVIAGIVGIPVLFGGVLLVAQAVLSSISRSTDAAGIGSDFQSGVMFLLVGGALTGPFFWLSSKNRL